MDFGDILSKWEKRGANNKIHDKDTELLEKRNTAGERRSRLLRKKPDASIDLHGLTRDEAWAALETFFENSRRNGLEKILIIHGKGNHHVTIPSNEIQRGFSYDSGSGEEGILKDLSRRFIENCSFAGESGYNPAKDGGTGATWVILKQRN